MIWMYEMKKRWWKREMFYFGHFKPRRKRRKHLHIVKFFQLVVSNGEDVQFCERVHIFHSGDTIVVQRQVLELCQFFETLYDFNVVEGEICNEKGTKRMRWTLWLVVYAPVYTLQFSIFVAFVCLVVVWLVELNCSMLVMVWDALGWLGWLVGCGCGCGCSVLDEIEIEIEIEMEMERWGGWEVWRGRGRDGEGRTYGRTRLLSTWVTWLTWLTVTVTVDCFV